MSTVFQPIVADDRVLSDGECSEEDPPLTVKSDDVVDEVALEPATRISDGWKIILAHLPSARLVTSAAREAKVGVPIPGMSALPPSSQRPVPVLLRDTFESVSRTIANAPLTNDLLSLKGVDCNIKGYRPDVPLWHAYKPGSLPVGLNAPPQWKFALSSAKIYELESLTAGSLQVSSFIELLADTQG